MRPGPGEERNPVYDAMVESMDESVGRVMDALERMEIADRTIPVFGSDNGGLTVAEPLVSGSSSHTPATTLAPLRAGKGHLYEGGLRVPWIVRLPGVTPPGSVSEEPIITHDFFPTLAELAGVPIDDPYLGERRDLAAERPKLAADLAGRLARWRRRVGAQMPEPNPERAPR